LLDIIIAYRRAKHSEAIRDKARALEVYARQARNVDAETRACEIRLRAERRCGQLLAEREKNKGGRPEENRSHAANGLDTLGDLGISKTQSSRWQKLAAIPDREFEATFAGTLENVFRHRSPGFRSTNDEHGAKAIVSQ
jgi:hypothetical protein